MRLRVIPFYFIFDKIKKIKIKFTILTLLFEGIGCLI